MRGLFGVTMALGYFVIGLIVASSHTYMEHLTALRPVVSSVLAVVLWPLLLVGINLHVK
jgi:Kef-type K+ transport system membrane component KefB